MTARVQLCFMHTRNWMMEGALALAFDPKARLLTKYPDMSGFRKVERILKPPSFYVANSARLTHTPPSKRAKIKFNVESPEVAAPAQSRGSNLGGYKRGAGGWMNQMGCNRGG